MLDESGSGSESRTRKLEVEPSLSFSFALFRSLARSAAVCIHRTQDTGQGVGVGAGTAFTRSREKARRGWAVSLVSVSAYVCFLFALNSLKASGSFLCGPSLYGLDASFFVRVVRRCLLLVARRSLPGARCSVPGEGYERRFRRSSRKERGKN